MLLRSVLLSLALASCRQKVFCKSLNMDLVKQFQSFAWCKPDWCFPSMSKETNELLKQCSELPKLEASDDVDEVIAKSKAFPIPFPIETVRLEKLKVRRSIDKLKKNIGSTYPLIHERVLLLMTHFLIYKREHGTAIEKEFYKDMTVPQFIDRILKKRAISFVGARDSYMLISGEEGVEGWEAIGTMNQRAPLLLENCLSYDEMKISALVYVSGHTECINDGSRKNAGIVNEENIEQSAVIIGTIGPRFERDFRMDFEDSLVTNEQNTFENGYGGGTTTNCSETFERTTRSLRMWRQMWAEFYQVPSYTYSELNTYIDSQEKDEEKSYTDRYVKLPKDYIFDNQVYYKRICVLIETVLIEAEARAKEDGRDAYVNVIGCGLGVWMISKHQTDVYVLTIIERVRHLLRKDMLQHVSDVNFAYIKPSKTVTAMFIPKDSPVKNAEKKIFIEHKAHPRGGIAVTLETREPSTKLSSNNSGKLLVLTYPWDGNAHPGNEFWSVRRLGTGKRKRSGPRFGSLTSSGDPAAACSTQVSELHNAHINSFVSSSHTRVASDSIHTLSSYCTQATQQ